MSLYGTYRLVKYCIEKKKCHDILRKTNPEPDETNSDDKNRDNHNDKNEIILAAGAFQIESGFQVYS